MTAQIIINPDRFQRLTIFQLAIQFLRQTVVHIGTSLQCRKADLCVYEERVEEIRPCNERIETNGPPKEWPYRASRPNVAFGGTVLLTQRRRVACFNSMKPSALECTSEAAGTVQLSRSGGPESELRCGSRSRSAESPDST
jgi:hypothetical protein